MATFVKAMTEKRLHLMFQSIIEMLSCRYPAGALTLFPDRRPLHLVTSIPSYPRQPYPKNPLEMRKQKSRRELKFVLSSWSQMRCVSSGT